MTALPVRTHPAPEQCITNWLEHVAEDNGLLTTQLGATLRRTGGTTRFLAVQPDPKTVSSIVDLTGATRDEVVASTLARFDGTALDLAGLDHGRWSSWRTVAARGWFRLRGTAACPACLVADGCWQVAWRLPTVTACTRHRCYLVELCPGCGRRFDDHPHEPLRHGAGTRCLNPIGERTACDVDVATLPAGGATAADMRRQERHNAACSGSPPRVLGSTVTASDYLSDVRHLAVLLLHLACQPGVGCHAGWVDVVRREAHDTRRTRWHLAAPAAPKVRSAVLVTADEILTAPSLGAAADALAPWIEAAPTGTESRLGWLADRTTMTPTLTRLTMAALAPHQRVGIHLTRTVRPSTPDAIPQVIPARLYRRHAAPLFSTDRGETNRAFLSLCLARQAGATTWAEAAELLGLKADFGTQTARAVSARSRPDPRHLTAALDTIRAELPRDYRRREQQVYALLRGDAWFEQWIDDDRPGTRATSFPYAVTHIWCEYAGGLLTTSPAWKSPPDQPTRAAYRQFAASLTPTAETALLDTARHRHGWAT